VDKKKGKFSGMVSSRGYNLASGTLFHMKLTGDIEQNFGKTMQVLFGDQVSYKNKTTFGAQLKK